MSKGLEEKILQLPDRYPAIFRGTALANIRNFIMFFLFALLTFLVLTLPELIWDEYKNYNVYEERLNSMVEQYTVTHDTSEADDVKVIKTWFSPRMWDYRRLMYTVHVKSPYKNLRTSEAKLAQWQKEQLQSEPSKEPSKTLLHYLYNPGFFWDLGILLPISLSALFMALYSLIGHLGKFRVPTQEGRQPYIPVAAAHTLLRCLFNPWTLGICLIGGFLVTAGNHGTGLLAKVDTNDGAIALLFKNILTIGYVAVIPFLYILIRCSKAVYHSCAQDNLTSTTILDTSKLLDSSKNWLRSLYWVAAACSGAALITVLSTYDGWVETITNIELAPYKPIQRIIKTSILTFGILSAIWVATMVIGRARTSLAIVAMTKAKNLKIEDRIGVFDDLVLNEIQILEYFGIFATFTILSYAQSAFFILQDADVQTTFGITILTGLILISLILLILPIIYLWYVFMDSRRFDNWVKKVEENGELSEKEQQILIRKQNARLLHVIKIIILRWRIIAPLVTLFGALFYTGSLTGLLADIFP